MTCSRSARRSPPCEKTQLRSPAFCRRAGLNGAGVRNLPRRKPQGPWGFGEASIIWVSHRCEVSIRKRRIALTLSRPCPGLNLRIYWKTPGAIFGLRIAAGRKGRSRTHGGIEGLAQGTDSLSSSQAGRAATGSRSIGRIKLRLVSSCPGFPLDFAHYGEQF